MTEQRTAGMEPGHDHRTGIICHLPEDLSAQPTGKGRNSQVLRVPSIVSSFCPTFVAETNLFTFVRGSVALTDILSVQGHSGFLHFSGTQCGTKTLTN